ncbi:unnamed protein product [Mytilus coruscus]|uniref:DZIP3-like HEPN domain-containing protein n=1 Tax=Mytilus coruscus TaxID=42192 RepID=A0A6J8EDQ4_MYTCO|nr:unnamed protein product [Mytilus coruscus]
MSALLQFELPASGHSECQHPAYWGCQQLEYSGCQHLQKKKDAKADHKGFLASQLYLDVTTLYVQAVSKDFDIRLMMVLLKNLTDLNIADVFPHKDDLTVDADLSRIKYLRNKIVQNSDRSITDEDFVDDWKHLSEAVERVGDGAYKKVCEELKNLKPTLLHVQEYLNSENLQSNQGEISTDSMSELYLENEVNNLLARDAVRRIFDKQFPPLKLGREIEAHRKELAVLKEERKITQSEWEDLFPTDKESLSSSRLDIKVMIILLSSTSFKDKDVFKTIENLQHHLSRPEYDDRAIKKAIKEINEAA